MYTGTLTEVTLDQTSRFLIESTEEQFHFLLEENDPSSLSNNPTAIDKFLTNVKRICLTKPKKWLKGILQKLNHLAAKINIYEETKPGERSIWSKIKAKLSSIIVSITHRLHSLLEKDPKMIFNKDRLEGNILDMKDDINSVSVNKRKTMHTIANKYLDHITKDKAANGNNWEQILNLLKKQRAAGLRKRFLDKYSKK